MRLMKWAFGAKRNEYLSAVAQRIAERTIDQVERRLSGLTPEMSAAEARGYIRVRAAAVVHRAVNRVVSQDRRLGTADRERLAQMTTELLTAALLRSAKPRRPSIAA